MFIIPINSTSEKISAFQGLVYVGTVRQSACLYKGFVAMLSITPLVVELIMNLPKHCGA